jgi:hypothetical protein
MKYSLVLVIVSLVFCCGSTDKRKSFTIDAEGLSLYKEKDLKSQIISKIPFNSEVIVEVITSDEIKTKVNLIDECGKWVEVKYGKYEGWTSDSGLSDRQKNVQDIRRHVFFVSPIKNIELHSISNCPNNGYKQMHEKFGKPLKVATKVFKHYEATIHSITEYYSNFTIEWHYYDDKSNPLFWRMEVFGDLNLRYNVRIGMSEGEVASFFYDDDSMMNQPNYDENFESIRFSFNKKKLSRIYLQQLMP